MKISYFPNFVPNNAELVYPKVLDAIKQTDTLAGMIVTGKQI